MKVHANMWDPSSYGRIRGAKNRRTRRLKRHNQFFLHLFPASVLDITMITAPKDIVSIQIHTHHVGRMQHAEKIYRLVLRKGSNRLHINLRNCKTDLANLDFAYRVIEYAQYLQQSRKKGTIHP